MNLSESKRIQANNHSEHNYKFQGSCECISHRINVVIHIGSQCLEKLIFSEGKTSIDSMNNLQKNISSLRANEKRRVHYPHVTVLRSVVMNIESFSAETPRWQIRYALNLARIVGVYRTRKNLQYFTHESAVLLHGLSPWNVEPSVYAATNSNRHKTTLPKVTINTEVFEPRGFRPTFSLQRSDEYLTIDNLPVESLENTAIRMVISRPAVDALVAVSQILHRLTRFSHFQWQYSRSLEKQVKQSLLVRLDKIQKEHPKLGNYDRGRVLINVADAACESAGEAALQPILYAVFSDALVSQYKIHMNGHDYFADFAVPEVHLIIEFDGVGKMGTNEQEFNDALHAQLNRQNAIESLGYSFIRVKWNDLLNPTDLYNRFVRYSMKKYSDFHLRSSTLKSLLESEAVI